MCIGLIACTSNDEITEQLSSNSEVLINCWTHSMEEDPNSNVQIYRPCDFMEFPVSRFRMTMTLHSDGTAEYLELSPVDAHQTVAGSWRFTEEDSNFQLMNEKEDAILSGTVGELSSDILAIRF